MTSKSGIRIPVKGHCTRWICPSFVVAIVGATCLVGSAEEPIRSFRNNPRTISRDVLTEAEWLALERAVDKGLAYLARQHRADGSFQPNVTHDPGISGLCVLAFMSRGHVPGQGPYGEKLNKSINFFLKCQQSDGLLSQQRHWKHSVYNHAICALVLSEVYGMCRPPEEDRFRIVIEKAIEFSGHRYSQPKRYAQDEGSWRYLVSRVQTDGDLSITSWNVMFLRSAKNSGFTVDPKLIEDAVGYMKRLYEPNVGSFRYLLSGDGNHSTEFSRAMAGAGVLALSLSGDHDSDLARGAAKFILKHPFNDYKGDPNSKEYPTYSAFYCSQGMFQMGGEYWTEYYSQLVKTLLKAQRADGSWWTTQSREGEFGLPYMTALSILALTPPYQMLPIFQR